MKRTPLSILVSNDLWNVSRFVATDFQCVCICLYCRCLCASSATATANATLLLPLMQLMPLLQSAKGTIVVIDRSKEEQKNKMKIWAWKKACATVRAVGILVGPQSATWELPFLPYCASLCLYVCRYNDLETRMIDRGGSAFPSTYLLALCLY
jgi:hypothetical protein